jgi:hypothetical protein
MSRLEFENKVRDLVDTFAAELPYCELCESLDLIAEYCAEKADKNG